MEEKKMEEIQTIRDVGIERVDGINERKWEENQEFLRIEEETIGRERKNLEDDLQKMRNQNQADLINLKNKNLMVEMKINETEKILEETARRQLDDEMNKIGRNQDFQKELIREKRELEMAQIREETEVNLKHFEIQEKISKDLIEKEEDICEQNKEFDWEAEKVEALKKSMGDINVFKIKNEMGPGLSKERKEELDAEYERNLRDDQQNEERNRLDQIRKIMKERQAEFEDGMKKKENDLLSEAEKNLELIQDALGDLEDLKVQNQQKLENWKSNFDEQGKQMKQELREEGDREIEKRQNDLKNYMEKLEKLQEELNEKRGALLKSMEEQNEFKEKLQKEHEEFTVNSVKDHQERLSKGKYELFNFQKSAKEDMKKLQEKEQAKQSEMMDEKKKQSAYQLSTNFQMLEAIKRDEKNVDFKSECDSIRMFYNRFKRSYGNDEQAIRKMICEMERNEKLEPMFFKVKMVLQRSWDILVMIFVYVRHKIAGRSPEPVVAIPKPQILPDVIPKDKLTIFNEVGAEFPKIYISTTQFEEQKRNIEIQHRCKMSQIKLESAENLKKSDMEFREQSAKEEEESEKELRELDRKIEEFERETKRMKEEQVLEIRKMNMAFFQCLLIQKKWEMDEKEFSKFLDSIREPISRLKTRYSLFEKVLKAQKRVKRDVLKRELTSLHGSTYHAYQSVYEGWENNQKESLENIKEKLSTLDAMDIPQTWKLREQSEIEPSDTLNFAQSPRFYEISSNVKITEV
ncbi:hypothetical protein L5515_015809 [Caenorhabditis briggsae]|uniref:Uncharacterized protein n=1 Tax=Caenorhabditis briggsae TaxID=6238 RepID=A0AAE9ECN3_CAEBR|nr:hypothetical protein L5515_015809 [Caenorhabditis briggsae]